MELFQLIPGFSRIFQGKIEIPGFSRAPGTLFIHIIFKKPLLTQTVEVLRLALFLHWSARNWTLTVASPVTLPLSFLFIITKVIIRPELKIEFDISREQILPWRIKQYNNIKV